MSWKSANPEVGLGSQTIVESEPYKLIRAHLDFGDEGTTHMAAHGFEKGDDPWEEYVSDPGSTPQGELITHVCYPVK